MNRSLALLAFCFGISAYAQSPLATVTGLASDSSGAVVVTANVTLVNQDTGVQRSAKTNEAGVYTFPNVPPGNYSLTAQAAGFKKIEVEAFPLEAFRTLRQDLKFEVAALPTEVTVAESSSTVIQVDTPSISSRCCTSRSSKCRPICARS